MSRRRALSLATRLVAAADELSTAAARQQGAKASVQLLQAATHPAASAQHAAALSTAATLRPLAAAAAATTLLPGARLAASHSLLQPSCLQAAPTRGLTTSNVAAAADEYEEGGALDPELPRGRGYGSRESRFATAREAAEYVKSNIHTLSAHDLGDVVRDFVELHFAQIARRGNRKETSLPYAEVVAAVLSEDSHLCSSATAVSHLLWGAAKLRHHSSEETRKALLAAADLCVQSFNHKDIAATLWALGWLRLNPSTEFLDGVGSRLFDDGLVSYFSVGELVPALTGVGMLRNMPRTLAEYLVADLAKKADSLTARQLGGICNLLPSMPHGEDTDVLTEKVFSQVAAVATQLDLVGVSTVLWAAAKLGATLDDDTLRALLATARQQLGANKGHAVPDMLWSLGKLGVRAGDGVLTEEFVRACIDSQMATMGRRVQPQKITKFLNACGMVRGQPTREELEACMKSIQEQDFFRMDDFGLNALMRACRGFQYWEGVDVCKTKLGISTERPRRQYPQRGQRQYQQGEGRQYQQRGRQGQQGGQEAEGEGGPVEGTASGQTLA